MPDIKFACTYCQQHIAAEPGYAGLQIACPACKKSIIVPGTPPSPTPPPRLASAYAPPPPPQHVPPPPIPTEACPSCGGPLQKGAKLCLACGYNLSTGQRAVAGRQAPRSKPSRPQGDAPWYKTIYPYLSLYMLILGVLYYFGRESPPSMLAFAGMAFVYILGVHITTSVFAFQESAGTGFLTLCLPFYALYFVFKQCDNDTLKLLYAILVVLNLTLKFLL